jgi:hypothetical protein
MKTLQEFFDFMSGKNPPKDDSPFNFQKFKELKTVEAMIVYCQKKLKFLGAGAFRAVFEIDSSKILKIVRQQEKAYQNRMEVGNAQCLGKQFAPIIYEYDEERYYWIIEENVKPNKQLLFSALDDRLDYRFNGWEELQSFFQYALSTNPAEKEDILYSNPHFKELYNKFMRTQWFSDLRFGLRNCRVGSRDFHDDNWGVRANGEPILIDLGFGEA